MLGATSFVGLYVSYAILVRVVAERFGKEG